MTTTTNTTNVTTADSAVDVSTVTFEVGKQYGPFKIIAINEEKTRADFERMMQGKVKQSRIFYIVEDTQDNNFRCTKSSLSLKNSIKSRAKNTGRHIVHTTFDLSGEYGVATCRGGVQFLFDKEDYDKIKDQIWRVNSDGRVVTKVNTPFYTMIMERPEAHEGCTRKPYVKYRNGNKLDLRKANLHFDKGQTFSAKMIVDKAKELGLLTDENMKSIIQSLTNDADTAKMIDKVEVDTED